MAGPSTKPPPAPVEREPRWRRLGAWAHEHPWWAGALAGGVLLVVASSVVGSLLVASAHQQQAEASLLLGIAAVERGDWYEAQRIGRRLHQQPGLPFEELGAPFYLLGAAAMLEAERAYEPEHARKLNLLAARYLAEADARGFPPGYESDGLWRLGRSLYESRQYPRCLPILERLLRTTSPPADAYRLLGGARLRDAKGDLAAAEQALLAYLEQPQLSADDQREGRLELARVLTRRNRADAARDVVAALPDQGDKERRVVLGQVLIGEARRLADPALTADLDDAARRQAIDAKLAAAIDTLRLAYDAEEADGTAASAEYLHGVALRLRGQFDDAERQFSRVRRLYVGTPEALMASLDEAELQLSPTDPVPAVEGFLRFLRDVGPAETYSNPWASYDELRSRVRVAHEALVATGHFDAALTIAKALPPLASLAEAVELRADTHRRWAVQLAESAVDKSELERDIAAFRARAQHRKAGRLYSWLARLRFASREYPHDLWRSGVSFLEGHAFRQAVEQFEQHLNVELLTRRPDVLVKLAEAQLSLQRLDEALAACETVIDLYPKHPASYTARLIASQAYVSKRTKSDQIGELAFLREAQQLLLANLVHEDLTPQSLEWRDSLFALGETYHQQGVVLEAMSRVQGVDAPLDSDALRIALRTLEASQAALHEAIARLDEAIARYPQAPQATYARYLAAESHRQAAKLPRKKLPTVTIETTRLQLLKEQQTELELAVAGYTELQKLLNQQQETQGLSAVEQSIMRNCYFARADAMFDSGRYEEALREYSTATNRYQHEPEALEAFVQIANCHRRLGRTSEARGTLEQAKVVLRRIRPDADFRRTTRYSRDEWEGLLNMLSSL